MNQEMSDLPQAETADPDGVQVALRAAQTLWSRGETSESLKWLRKAAESASDEGADVRSLQLAKAAAELRAKLFSGDASRAGTGEISGAHPIAEHAAASTRAPAGHTSSRPEADAAHSSFPPAAYAAELGDSSGGEHAAGQSSRPVTATQYPSHRPRQRIGLTSSIPGAPPSPAEGAAYGSREGAYGTRDGAAYAAVPSWSADAERRVSPAPPPLPLSAIDDYEELEAEPDDEPADDPGSVWSGTGESWRPPEPGADATDGRSPLASSESASAGSSPVVSVATSAESNPSPSSFAPSHVAPSRLQPMALPGTSVASAGSSSALPPPLPPRGAFADDDGDFGPLGEPPTLVIPSADEPDAGPGREPRWTESGDVWDRQSRLSGWDQDSGGAWAADLRSEGWGSLPMGSADASGEVSTGAAPSDSEAATLEGPPPSDTSRAKLTARVHHQAVRVSFAPDLRVPGQYVVRALREGEKAAAGERIALLVALEPGVPLV